MKYLGKMRLPHRKNTANMRSEPMPPPKEVVLPMLQHIGAPAEPVVSVGESVAIGQLIARANGKLSSPIYASVSGKVSDIREDSRSDSGSIYAISIESDGEMRKHREISPPRVDNVDGLIDAARSSGVVGLGGAGFPTAVKLEALRDGEIHTVIINGAECEPYITCDTRVMLEECRLIGLGIATLEKCAPRVEKYIIAIEENKPECIKKMKELFSDDRRVTVHTLSSRYPQGSERILIYNTTGIEVAEKKLVHEAGVIVLNVNTLATLAEYIESGMPMVRRRITLDGGALRSPKNIIAPLGARVGDIVDFSGGVSREPHKIILGGVMTGSETVSMSEPIIKTTGAIIFLSLDECREKPSIACIRCGRCVSVCPHFLDPVSFSRLLNIEDREERVKKLRSAGIMMCMECGCCSYICPSRRPLVENNRLGKKEVREYIAERKSCSDR